MAPAYYIYKYPYKLGWYIAKLFKKNRELVFYCADPLDYEMFVPIKKHLPEIEIVAKNKKTRDYLEKKEIPYLRMPTFPKAVIMGRHSAYKFPVKQIIKIGFNHGLYQFKRWTATEHFNRFNIFFVSSGEQVKAAKARGITTTKAIGYPKLDNAFNGIYDENYLEKLKDKINIDRKKKTIVFTSTWNLHELSALDRWIDRVEELTTNYNILFTVHTWTEERKVEKLKGIQGTFFINSFDVTPYLMIANIVVGDYSSIIGEACGLNKPIITFRVPESKRSITEIHEMIKKISIQIDNFNELHSAIEQSLNNPENLKDERGNANKIMYLALDGNAGMRATEEIEKLIGIV